MPAAARTDICVLGGSIAGLLFAQKLKASRHSLTVLDDAPDSGGDDGKTLVIDRRAAGHLAAIDALPASSVAIEKVQVSVGRFLRHTIGGSGSNEPLGYSISAPQVQEKLRRGLRLRQARMQHIAIAEDGVEITARDRRGRSSTLRARLLVIACPLAALPPPFATRRLPYHQTILSMPAESALPPRSARQRFGARRVLVLVPRADSGGGDGGNTGVIICAASATAGALSAMSDSALSAMLSEEFALPVRVQGRRFAYAPQLVRHTPLAHPPVVLLGSGATTLHPIGAQAISLAVQDAHHLAAAFGSGDAALPKADALMRYQRRRLFSHRRKAALTSTLALAAFGAGGLC